MLALWGCSSVKYVPEGEYLLDDARIVINDNDDIKPSELQNFLRQQPNHKVLGVARLQLSTYSLSGRDSTKWYNKWLRNLGQPPVIYDEELTEASRRQLHQALVNRGYMEATVAVDTVARKDKKRIKVTYTINTGTPHTISSIDYDIPDTAIRNIVMADTTSLPMHVGELFDRNQLDNCRAKIAERMRNSGYYAFNRDCIHYYADTISGSKTVGLTLTMRDLSEAETRLAKAYTDYRLNRVIFVTTEGAAIDTVRYRKIEVIYGADRYLRPSVLEEKCYLVPGNLYKAADVDRTYEALSRLGILKYINIEMQPAGEVCGEMWLDAVITLSRNKKQGVALTLEGTNSEGDLGFGVGLTYQHRNLAKGSEMLTAKFRAAYESLSGDIEGLINNRFSEYAGEVGLTIPKFVCPFLSKGFRQRMRASTEFALSFNYQERPEYTRIIAGAAWRWKWSHRAREFMRSHTYDLIDINYVRLPNSKIDFLDEVGMQNPLLRYSYEDHFIMRMGYTFQRTNRRIPTTTVNAFAIQPWVSTLRASAETAGNLLYGISSIIGQHSDDGAYKVFGIQYAQYFKAEVDYTYTRNFNSRNALATHVGFGITVPYGNSDMVPFEKRFYAGGANGVRGWGVRSLGPGAYDSKNSVNDFINQCGDIRFDMSVEYRAKLFWVLESAVFVDAGNIWTIRDYPSQPGGVFKFSNFFKQIALAYGIGLRMDFTYFLLRLDLGFKAHNPATNQEEWPLIHPKWSRDANFHFSVGYPF
ncbi:MAG: BamA/TamA family outer membrane protein [Muribaculaceae bacterium]